jgi:predicted lipoprotein with Yx(FWY)xxD motif
MEQLDDRHAGQVGRLPAEMRPRRGGVDDPAFQVAEGDEVVRALDDEPANGVVKRLGSGRARLRSAARGSPPKSAFARRSLHDLSEEGQSIRGGVPYVLDDANIKSKGDDMKAIGLIAIVVAAVALAGLGTASGASGSAAHAAAVSTAKTGLGKIIVNSRGRTLYLFEKDKRHHSACAGACASYWPPLLTHGKPVATGGAKRSLLGTIKRADGTRQVTYAGHPLYTYLLDSKRGQTNGEGSTLFGGGWDALAPSGKKIEADG